MNSLANEKLLLSLLTLLAFGLNSIHLFYFLETTQIKRNLSEVAFVLLVFTVHIFSVFLLIVSVVGLVSLP